MSSLQPIYQLTTTNVDPNLVAEIAHLGGLPLEVARILAVRAGSLEEAKRWLNPSEMTISDPFSFSDMSKALARIIEAIKAQEHIIVFGDYDVDGITATILMTQALDAWGAKVSPFFPDRFAEGYGLSLDALKRCFKIHQSRGNVRPSLIVTVDCGITSVAEVDWLREQGIEVVITDHHMPLDVLPNAVAVVNPRVGADDSATEASGCATAYAVVRAFAKELQQPPLLLPKTQTPLAIKRRQPETYLDLVAVSTIADVMALVGDNRAFVWHGLRTLTAPQAGNMGLNALLDVLDLRKPNVCLNAERVAFSICPCINAAGRLGKLHSVYSLLNLPEQATFEERRQRAETLKTINEERREIEHALYQHIKKQCPIEVGKPFIFGGVEDVFHPGVIGIVAARIIEHTKAPVAILHLDQEGGGHGSMRSNDTYNAVEILKHLEPFLHHFGGHAQAAGFTIKPGMYEAFCKAFPSACEAVREEASQAPLVVDVDLSMIPITNVICSALSVLEPYGNGNPRPTFVKSFEPISTRVIGADRSHLALMLRPDDGGEPLKAVWFGGAAHERAFIIGKPFRAIFTLELDTYRQPCPNVRLLQLL